eukprot:PITA_07232
MCDIIVVVGLGYKSATYEDLRGPILQAEKQDINSRLDELKKTWEVIGCTVMSDGWTDRKGRTLLNFLVHCPKDTMFIKSLDASEHIKDAATISELLDGFIREIGVQNVVQVITDNAANYVSVGKMLMERHPTLFWTLCAAHCLDLLLEDMGKLSFIKEAVDMARSVPKFIYNHTFVLSLMRRYSRRHDRKAIAKMVYSETFWRGVEEACAVSEPIVKVLKLVDGEKPAMDYLYEGMDRAKEAIRSYYADKGSVGLDRQMMLWDVINSQWTWMLHRPIHATALFLNPAFSYKCDFDFDGEVMEGLHSCIQRMVPDPEPHSKINREIQYYRDCIGLFGFDDAIRERTLFMPHIWWQSYGARAPNLQKLAIQILSQTCSSSGCVRNWSVFEKIHAKMRNRLEFARLNDLVYVHYNIRLRVRQIESPMDPNAISLDNIDVLSQWRVESEEPILEESPSWLEPVANDPLEQG